MSLDVERLLRLGRVSTVAPAPDGTWVAVAVARLDDDGAKFVSDIWKVSTREGEFEPVQLTRGESNDHAPWFRPDGSLAFLGDRKKTEKNEDEDEDPVDQVWLLPVAGGEPMQITEEPLGVSAFRLAGDKLVVIAPVLPGVPHDEQRETRRKQRKDGPSALHYTSMPVRFWDHWLQPAAPHVICYAADGTDRKDLTPDADREYREASWDLSEDGARVAITHASMGEDRVWDSCVRIIETADGATRDLGVHPRVMHESPRFSPDGKKVAATREERFPKECLTAVLHVYDVASGKGEPLAERWDRWATPWCWSADGQGLVVVADDRGDAPVFVVDTSSGEVVRITAEEAGGTHTCVSRLPGSDAVVGVRHRTLHPPEPFRVELKSSATPALLAGLSGFTEEDGAAIASRESFYVDTEEGHPVHTVLLTPKSPSGPAPVLLWVHGGPIGAWTDAWHWRWNPLVPASAGYAMILPNPTGSTGWGHDFIAGIWGNTWGDACYRELMAVTDACLERDTLDSNRVGVMGGSFGGYMANWIGGHTDRFGCIITHASIYDLSAFHGVTDVPGFFALELGGTPYDDLEAFERYSPHRFVKNWKSPTLVIHGERDYRVPVGEGLALFEALQLHGVDSELLAFPDENHWILKPRNVRVWYETVLSFLSKHL